MGSCVPPPGSESFGAGPIFKMGGLRPRAASSWPSDVDGKWQGWVEPEASLLVLGCTG